ncbi:hypothetical protein GX408_04955 [bacterium]|nr:hypothetical protein [bacterium]
MQIVSTSSCRAVHRWALLGLCTLLLAVSACQLAPTEAEKSPQIRLSIHVADQRPEATLRNTAGFDPLAKAAGMVSDQVVLLHCDEDSGDQLIDASRYGNHAFLYNVSRIDSSANATLKKALDFARTGSYAVLQSVGELNATHGLTVDLYFYLKLPYSETEQRLLDRMDSFGGYTIAVANGRVQLQVNQSGKIMTIAGRSIPTPSTWHHLQAFVQPDSGKYGLRLNGRVEAEEPFTGVISSCSRQMLLGAGYSGASIAYPFWGRMDEISITTRVEYIDFDALRVMVFDISAFTSLKDFSSSDAHYQYHSAFESMISDADKAPTWEMWKAILTDFFDRPASETILTVPEGGAFAEGLVRGVPGLNYIVIGAVQRNQLTYVGYSALYVSAGQELTDADITIWPL